MALNAERPRGRGSFLAATLRIPPREPPHALVRGRVRVLPGGALHDEGEGAPLLLQLLQRLRRPGDHDSLTHMRAGRGIGATFNTSDIVCQRRRW